MARRLTPETEAGAGVLVGAGLPTPPGRWMPAPLRSPSAGVRVRAGGGAGAGPGDQPEAGEGVAGGSGRKQVVHRGRPDAFAASGSPNKVPARAPQTDWPDSAAMCAWP